MNPLIHLRRSLQWQLRNVEPTPGEVKALPNAGADGEVMTSYFVWRRSSLAIATLFLIAAAALAIISTLRTPLEGFNTLGIVLIWVQTLSIPFLMIMTALAFFRWTRTKQSHRLLLAGWTVSFVVPLALAVLPIRWVLDGSLYTNEDISVVSTIQALVNSLALLPVLATFPAGVLRGSLRAKGVLPTAVMPGWFLVGSAPFYGLIFVAGLSVIDQIAASPLLVVGAVLLAVAPWYFTLKVNTFVRPALSDDDMSQMQRVQRTISLLVLVGIALVTVWALTSRVDILGNSFAVVGRGDDALFDPVGALSSVGELVGRWMTTTILYTHVFVRSLVTNWRHEEKLRTSDQYEAHQDFMLQAERATAVHTASAPSGI